MTEAPAEAIGNGSTSSRHSSPQQRTFFGFPYGILLLSFTELWERFSYYGMLAILVLFLSTPVSRGGFGWSEQSALELYGFYSGLAFTAPVLGGWIASRYWGERRCILVGGILIAIGHSLMAMPVLIHHLAHSYWGADFNALFRSTNAPLGHVFGGASLETVRTAAVNAGISADAAAFVYQSVSGTFLSGLCSIIAGTALLKPTISSIVGQFYNEDDERRDSAFALFLVGIYLGQIFGVAIAGYLGERVSWHMGFGAAGIGMVIGLLAYTSNQRRLLGDKGLKLAPEIQASSRKGLTSAEWDRIKVIGIIVAFTTVYSMAMFQNGGLLTLFANEYVDRQRWGWEIPASWFMMINSILFVILTPVLAVFWQCLSTQGRTVLTSQKLAGALIAIGVGYLVIAYPVLGAAQQSHVLISPLWLIGMYLLFGLSEALVWTGTLSLTTRLAPKRLTAIFVGIYYLSIGVGSWLAGYVGAYGYAIGPSRIFLLLAAVSLAAGSWLLALSRRLSRMTHGIEG